MKLTGTENIELNTLYNQDCILFMKGLPDKSVDTIITDPPYCLSSIGKRWGKTSWDKEKYKQKELEQGGTVYTRAIKGFMGKEWDNDIAQKVELWKECLRVAKPGATLLCFGGTRTFHRIAVAIEDAGWDIFDTMMWLYGQGFPKSLNIGKSITAYQTTRKSGTGGIRQTGMGEKYEKVVQDDTRRGKMFDANAKKDEYSIELTSDAKQWSGFGTSLKPAFEPIIVARKKCEGSFAENALKYGVAGLNIDGARIEYKNESDKRVGTDATAEGFSQGSVNFGINPRGKGILMYKSNGRFPSNVILGCSCESEHNPDCPVGMIDEQSGTKSSGHWSYKQPKNGGLLKLGLKDKEDKGCSDKGGASRFYYCAKASKSERNAGCEGLEEKRACGMGYDIGLGEAGEGMFKDRNTLKRNTHPTVKPLKLMEYLCQLTNTPTGGIVFDPFMGSGTTAVAAERLGRNWVGTEISPEYCAIAEKRINAERAQLKLNLKGENLC